MSEQHPIPPFPFPSRPQTLVPTIRGFLVVILLLMLAALIFTPYIWILVGAMIVIEIILKVTTKHLAVVKNGGDRSYWLLQEGGSIVPAKPGRYWSWKFPELFAFKKKTRFGINFPSSGGLSSVTTWDLVECTITFCNDSYHNLETAQAVMDWTTQVLKSCKEHRDKDKLLAYLRKCRAGETFTPPNTQISDVSEEHVY